ncbi:unnamed protein product [Brachionus calyciflorus]|uniref:Citramalyl-CoA lyase, mitochondrial n=1 Tax=Brachionus calyciflorus TaxID=104777 RepID=A0A813WQK4_9BILA|nr:unnamed protein product [Brachionus calyciflorus]
MISFRGKAHQFLTQISFYRFQLESKRLLHLSNRLCSNDASFRVSYPTRAVLYVPGSDSKKLTKIFTTNADCVVMDCEDGVALNKKAEAREKIRNLYDTDERVQNNTEGKFAVRINPAETDLASEDIKILFNPKSDILKNNSINNLLPKCIFVPKTSTSQEVKWLFENLNNQLKNYDDLIKLNLFFYMETAIGLINLNDIIKTALSLSKDKYNSKFNLEGFVFGSDDFCADIEATRTKDAFELTYARQKLIAYCKGYKLKVIDMVYIDFKDLEGLRVQCEQGSRMGFTGKQVIHPGQVDVCQQAFTPSKERIDWALGLIEAFDQHQKSGAGAFTYKGQMIDMPSLLQAKNILKIVEKVKKN